MRHKILAQAVILSILHLNVFTLCIPNADAGILSKSVYKVAVRKAAMRQAAQKTALRKTSQKSALRRLTKKNLPSNMAGKTSRVVSARSGQPIFFHATLTESRKKILKHGFNSSKMKPSARYGKGVYIAKQRKTSIAEAPKAQESIRFKGSNYLKNNMIDMTKPTPIKIRRFVREPNLRGDIKNGSIGPKLAHKIGKKAASQGKVVKYSSAKGAGTNIVIPQQLYKKHPRIIRAEGFSKIKNHSLNMQKVPTLN